MTMRYAIFSDIHANLEALEAVLAKIDELTQEEPIDQIWFLGDLVGYGPDPNECILKLREHTDVIIAGNHDWAAVGKIDLEDFSAAARISAEWTAEQLTEEHRTFLTNLPERLELGDCTLVHGSPYGPLWEYLTSEILAERSFQYFVSRYCFVGHTHVPVIFQQPDSIANAPTLPLESKEPETGLPSRSNGIEYHTDTNDEETSEMVAVRPPVQQSTLSAKTAGSAMSAYKDPESGQTATEDEANAILEEQMPLPDEASIIVEDNEDQSTSPTAYAPVQDEDTLTLEDDDVETAVLLEEGNSTASVSKETFVEEIDRTQETDTPPDVHTARQAETPLDSEQVNPDDYTNSDDDAEETDESTPELITASTDDLSSEIEELLTLLGLSQSMIQVTNEMITPPEGQWEAPDGYRAIINPGGVGQPRDGDPRAAFMIYDTKRGIEFYRVPYPIEKTQEKIIKAGLPHYLAIRLAYGR